MWNIFNKIVLSACHCIHFRDLQKALKRFKCLKGFCNFGGGVGCHNTLRNTHISFNSVLALKGRECFGPHRSFSTTQNISYMVMMHCAL